MTDKALRERYYEAQKRLTSLLKTHHANDRMVIRAEIEFAEAREAYEHRPTVRRDGPGRWLVHRGLPRLSSRCGRIVGGKKSYLAFATGRQDGGEVSLGYFTTLRAAAVAIVAAASPQASDA